MTNWTCPSCGTRVENLVRWRNYMCPVCHTYMKGSQPLRYWLADGIFMLLLVGLFAVVRP